MDDVLQRLIESDGFVVGLCVGMVVGATLASFFAYEAGMRRTLTLLNTPAHDLDSPPENNGEFRHG